MDRDTLDYTLRRGLTGLVRRLDELGETDLQPDQRVAVTLAVADARQMLSAFERAAPETDRPVETPTFDDPPAVLIVDDNPTNVALLQAMLGSMGVEATSASRGTEALAAFEGMPFDVVFMDVMLPGDDGLTVTRHIRERHGDRPYVVGVSALPGAKARCLQGGMDAFMSKPIHLADVSGVIEQSQAASRPAG